MDADNRSRADWIQLLCNKGGTLSPDEIEQLCSDADNSNWTGGPVEAMAPQHCEEFREISKELAELYLTDRDAWAEAYEQCPPLFKAACEFGKAATKWFEDYEESGGAGDTEELHAWWVRVVELLNMPPYRAMIAERDRPFYDKLRALAPGTRVYLAAGRAKGLWIKLDTEDEHVTGQFCNCHTGRLAHYSWLHQYPHQPLVL